MKKFFIILFLVLLLGAVRTFAELEVSGFVDILSQSQQGENTTFGMGAFEIDFASEFSEKVCFEGAVVIEGNEVGLGQTLVDFKLLNEDKVSLLAGLLDMPFGIDYQVFATPDRKLVTPPLVTELMMDGGWGDVGVDLYGSLSLLNYDLYFVNGMGEKKKNGVPVNQSTDNNNARTVGMRIGVLPVKDFEFGVSYAQGPYLDDNTEDILLRAGVDIQFVCEPLQIKGEFIGGKEEVPGAGDNEHEGYYIQVLGKTKEKFYGVVRYGCWRPKGGNEVTRTTIGLGYDLEENVSLRSEYQSNNETPIVDDNLFSIQVVISF